MKRTQIQLDEETYAALRQRAFDARQSISAVVRETLAAALKVRPSGPSTIREFRFVGSGRSPRRSGRPVSERHDAALSEAFSATGRRRR